MRCASCWQMQVVYIIPSSLRRYGPDCAPIPEYVFTSSNHTTHEPSWLRKIFSKYLKASGLRAMPFHALRHPYASALLAKKPMRGKYGKFVVIDGKPAMKNGASLTYVKEQMGHHSINVTVDTYGHLIPSANRAEVNKLDDEGEWESATQAQPEHFPLAAAVANAR